MPGAASKKSFGVLMHESTGSPVPPLPAPPDLTSAPADLRAPAAEYREQVENVISPLIIDALAGPPEPGPPPAWTGRVPDLSPEALAEIDATMRMAEGWAFAAGAAAGFAYAVKLLLLVGVAFAASRIGSVDRLALLAAVAVGLVVSLAVDALVVLLSRQSDFRETHDGDSQPR